MSKVFTLGKQERLKSRKQTEFLFSHGKKFSMPLFRILYVVQSKELTGLRFGVGVSSRHFKKSVDRNRVKRLVRESWRLQKLELQQGLATQQRGMDVFVIYTGKELPAYPDVSDQMGKIIAKLYQLLQTNT